MIRLLYIFQPIPFCSNLFPFSPTYSLLLAVDSLKIWQTLQYLFIDPRTLIRHIIPSTAQVAGCGIVSYRLKMPDNKFLHTRRIRNWKRNVSHLYIEQNQPHHPYIHIHIALMMETICQSCSSHNNNNNKNNNRERYSNNIAWRANILNGTSNQISCNAHTHTHTSAHVDRYIYNS